MIVLVLPRFGKRAAFDAQAQALERLGRIAIVDPLDLGDDDALERRFDGDLEALRAGLVVERSVGLEKRRVRREIFDSDRAPDPVDAGYDAEADEPRLVALRGLPLRGRRTLGVRVLRRQADDS